MLLLLSGTHIGPKSDVPLVRNARVKKNRRPSRTKRPFLVLGQQKRTFGCGVASVQHCLLRKIHAFGPEPDNKCNSVAEWRACFFFPTVKHSLFYHFRGLRHPKWTFCCGVANVHRVFHCKTHAFCSDLAWNCDSAAEWSAPLFFATVKHDRFVVFWPNSGVKTILFAKIDDLGTSWRRLAA